MNKELLMKKYKSGDIGPEDQQLLESYIEEGLISIEELEDLHALQESASVKVENVPSESMRMKFYQILAAEKKRINKDTAWNRLWNALTVEMPIRGYYRLAYTFTILFIGLGAGWLLSPAGEYKSQLSNINAEVLEMKEMMMLSLLENPAATDRLKAVSMSPDLRSDDTKIVDALFNTLNNDENVNVRLAALDVLGGYADQPNVREGLVRSISMQESPLVQMEMASLMVLLQEKRSVEELKKIIERERTDPAVKKRLQEDVGELI